MSGFVAKFALSMFSLSLRFCVSFSGFVFWGARPNLPLTVRISSTTHTVNTDQRRIELKPTSAKGTTYTITIPSDAGVALPGAWMVFALTSAGVPSVAKVVKITLT